MCALSLCVRPGALPGAVLSPAFPSPGSSLEPEELGCGDPQGAARSRAAHRHAGQACLCVPREQGSVRLKVRRRSDIPVFPFLDVQGGAYSHLPPPLTSRIAASASSDDLRSVERKDCPGNAGSQASALAECLRRHPGSCNWLSSPALSLPGQLTAECLKPTDEHSPPYVVYYLNDRPDMFDLLTHQLAKGKKHAGLSKQGGKKENFYFRTGHFEN